MSTTVQLQRRLSSPPPQERAALERRAKMLAWGGNAWHVVEFAIAVWPWPEEKPCTSMM